MYQKNVASVDNDTQIDDKTEYTQNHNVTYIWCHVKNKSQ